MLRAAHSAPTQFIAELKRSAEIMNKTYYYCCSLPLLPGSRVGPGNWGRFLRKYTQKSGNHWLLTRELVYENVRISLFPDKPSRLNCIFICETFEALAHFKNQNGRVFDLTYEVELCQPDMPIHRGDLSLLNFSDTDTIEIFRAKAELFWSGDNIVMPEVLSASEIIIKKEIK